MTPSTEELTRQRLIYLHAKERDRQLWLVGGLKISYAEFRRRAAVVQSNMDGGAAAAPQPRLGAAELDAARANGLQEALDLMRGCRLHTCANTEQRIVERQAQLRREGRKA